MNDYEIRDIINKKLLQTNSFNIDESVVLDDKFYAETYENYIIAQPLTAEAERLLISNEYIRLLQFPSYIYAIFYFPENIFSPSDIENNLKKMPQKYVTRYNNLMTAEKKGSIFLWYNLILPIKEFLKFEYRAKEINKRKDRDYNDDEQDTTCIKLTKNQKGFAPIEKVNLKYNTLIFLNNAKCNGNKALFHYKTATQFYTDCIINYLLEHSKIISPENFKYNNSPKELKIKGNELFKLYPHKSFKLEVPDGVKIIISRNDLILSNDDKTRISKNDIITFQFSDEYLAKYKNLITRDNIMLSEVYSFLHIPMFFVLQALKRENLSASGFKFMLWIICFFRMKNPTIFHNVRTIIEEVGLDTKHGYKKPLRILTKYFKYLFDVGMLGDVPKPPEFSIKDLDSPPKVNGRLIKITKPKLKDKPNEIV